jgi:hypothetical protein
MCAELLDESCEFLSRHVLYERIVTNREKVVDGCVRCEGIVHDLHPFTLLLRRTFVGHVVLPSLFGR